MKIAVEQLKATATAILQRVGIPAEEARVVADNLVKAEMRGIPTHGVNFLPLIAQRIKSEMLTVPTKLTILSESGSTTHIDGGNGLGQVAATKAMRQSIQNARSYGTGISLVRNTNHIGLLAFYTQMAAEAGMIGICTCNSAASMAPWGGAEAFFGTNPFSIAAPGGEDAPIVLDMSTSVVARGKIRRAQRMKQSIPLGWARDESGTPTDDPAAALRGTLEPIGGPKGYGMAFFVDLIAGLLSGSKFSRSVSTFHQPLSPTGVGVMTMAIDISRFIPVDDFRSRVSDHIGAIRSSRKAGSASRIYLPGEIEAENERRAMTEGVEIDEEVRRALEQLKKELGLPVGEAATSRSDKSTGAGGIS